MAKFEVNKTRKTIVNLGVGRVKPAIGRPYIPAYRFLHRARVYVRLSAFCLRIYATTKVRSVCLRLREQCLRSEITPVARVAHVLLLPFVAGNVGVNTPASKQWRINHGANGARARAPRSEGPPEQKHISLDNAFLSNGPVCGVPKINRPHDTFQSSHVAL